MSTTSTQSESVIPLPAAHLSWRCQWHIQTSAGTSPAEPPKASATQQKQHPQAQKGAETTRRRKQTRIYQVYIIHTYTYINKLLENLYVQLWQPKELSWSKQQPSCSPSLEFWCGNLPIAISIHQPGTAKLIRWNLKPPQCGKWPGPLRFSGRNNWIWFNAEWNLWDFLGTQRHML